MNSNSKTLIVICGPTAVGKTNYAITIAQHFNAPILSTDSRQCYKELNIGVARPSDDELQAVPHFFIASHSIKDNLNAAWYEKYSLKLLHELFTKHNVVVACGGTGLYIKALVDGLDEIPGVSEEIRESIVENYRQQGIDWLQSELQRKDALFSAEGEMKNPQRMMRALEVVEATGKSILTFRTKAKAERGFNIVKMGLEMPRENLNVRINNRVDVMMGTGFEAEAKALLAFRQLNALQTVGYKEMFNYFDGNVSLPQAIELIKQNTRRYAKRQMTWFKKQETINWINVSDNNNILSFAKQLLAVE